MVIIRNKKRATLSKTNLLTSEGCLPRIWPSKQTPAFENPSQIPYATGQSYFELVTPGRIDPPQRISPSFGCHEPASKFISTIQSAELPTFADCQSINMRSLLADTQSCDKQQNELLMMSPKIPEPGKPGITKQTISKIDETAQHCQQKIITLESTEHQTTRPTSPTSPAIEISPLDDQNSKIEPLIHFYSCCKLSFLIKMASLQNIKNLGLTLSEEDVNQEDEAMEAARAKALEAWERIRNSELSYDVVGSEYLRSCTLH